MEKKKRQHYVPKLYLNRFSSVTDTIAVFDKQSGHSFNTNVENVAVEGYFYDFDEPISTEDVQFLENNLSEMETEYSNLLDSFFKSITKSRRFDKELKALFALYLVIQFLRTKEYRKKETQVRAAVIEIINQDLRQQGYHLKYGYDDEAKMHFISMFDPKAISTLIDELLKKSWLVWKNKTSQPFYTSDNPVVVISEVTEPAGFATPGAEVLLPLSPGYLLDICDGEHFSDWRRFDCKVVNIRDVSRINRYNMAQVKYSTRQIYCSVDDFALARDMIEKNPEIREPSRTRITVDQFGDDIIKLSNR